MQVVSFTLNGKPTRIEVDPGRPLLWVLRDDLGLTGTKFGCGQAVCGSCTVLLDDEAVRSCATPVGDVHGRRVLTIEGLAAGDRLNPVQQAFADLHAFQCGYCTPGMILAAYALLLKNPRPTRAQVVGGLDGHLCRCGAHTRILQAVDQAAAAMRGGAR
ncbi:MAG: 2Fe-2S ferredoxin, related to 4-hydroxybenzoyl-CoA reductase [Acidobacteria bacterium]|nr:2Fe-2S ferredoxin, related to 4-hydroxybenzoyl-CoA reductase [Acidobacteriota bacterium]